MKKIAALFTASLFLSIAATAQITITSADMPNAGDALRVSLTNSLGSNNPTTTGANYTWDYSSLTPSAQRNEVFQAPSNFVTPYNFIFNAFNTSYGKDNYTITNTSFPVPGIQITAAYDFIKESASDLKQIGAGYVVNGAPLPFLYTNPDVIYKFPMSYLNIDSANYKFGLAIPTFGYYGQSGKRINEVDGWGTLITPYGTFQTLRVKSTITATDTIFVTSLNFGSKITRPMKYEFKWLTLGEKIPLLQIDANVTGANLTLSGVVYRDSVRNVPQVGVNELAATTYNIKVFPNPVADKAMISYELNAETNVQISVIDVLGKTISSEKMNRQEKGMHTKELTVNSFSKGIYYVKIEINNTTVTKKLIVD